VVVQELEMQKVSLVPMVLVEAVEALVGPLVVQIVALAVTA
jgi:hypothetical protein